jgi:hypothetical protein
MSQSEILDMMRAMRSFGNIEKDNVEKWQQSDVCELGFQHITDMDIVNASMKQKGEEGGWKG